MKSRVTPCQFGGTPDCSQCGCMASAGLKAVGDYRLLGFVPLRSLYDASDAVGKRVGVNLDRHTKVTSLAGEKRPLRLQKAAT